MRERYQLPPRLFLYTLDQIADLLVVDTVDKFIYYDGKSTGIPPKDKLFARNIAPQSTSPEWRVEEMEFVRWMRHTGLVPHRRH